MAAFESIKRNLAGIQARIDAAARRVDRESSEITLVAVTKYVGLEEVRALYELGVRHFGENRPLQAREKIEAMPDDIAWHMIGNIQRRKAREVAGLFQWADAIERPEVAEALEKRCAAAGSTLKTMVEVNVSGETTKQGVAPEDAAASLAVLREAPHLEPVGLMTLAPYEAPEADIRQYFRRLKTLCATLGVAECSMGMTDDFEWAIEEGSTQVRIGRALFEG